MALFTMDSAGLDFNGDLSKVESYLYKLDRDLRYMFTHLTPEENYSEDARLIYVANEERQSTIEVSLDQINLEMVKKDEVVSAINLSEEGVKIQGEKISLEGVVTVNSYFKVGLDGSIEATNGYFSGDIEASNIYGSTLTAGGSDDGEIIIMDSSSTEIGRWDKNGIAVYEGVLNLLWGSEAGVYADGTRFQVGDFVCDSSYGRSIFQSTDEMTGMSADPDNSNSLYLWAGYTSASDYVFLVNGSDAYVMYGGQAYPIGESLANLNDAISVYAEENTGDDIDDYEDEDESVVSGLVYEDGWVISPATS